MAPMTIKAIEPHSRRVPVCLVSVSVPGSSAGKTTGSSSWRSVTVRSSTQSLPIPQTDEGDESHRYGSATSEKGAFAEVAANIVMSRSSFG